MTELERKMSKTPLIKQARQKLTKLQDDYKIEIEKNSILRNLFEFNSNILTQEIDVEIVKLELQVIGNLEYIMQNSNIVNDLRRRASLFLNKWDNYLAYAQGEKSSIREKQIFLKKIKLNYW